MHSKLRCGGDQTGPGCHQWLDSRSGYGPCNRLRSQNHGPECKVSLSPNPKSVLLPGEKNFSKYLPYAVAMELYLTGEPLDAKRAYDLGFVNRVVPAGELMKETLRFADIIKGNAPLTMKMLKMVAVTQTHSARTAWLLTRARYVRPQEESEDFKEGLRCIFRKEEARFYRSIVDELGVNFLNRRREI